MRQAFLNAFGDDIAGCITETSDSLIKAFDCYDCQPADQRSYLVTAKDQEEDFTLQNPERHSLIFVAIDNCILQPADGPRCDFAIGNFQKLFLVEVKRANPRQKANARDSAVQQLSATLTWLRAHLDLHQTELIAVMNMKGKQPYPVQSARKAADRVRFLEEHRADLVEGQVARF